MLEQVNHLSDKTEASNGEESPHIQLVPKRFWWLKRFVILAGCLLVVLACLRWWWGFEARRRLEAAIGEYRRAGQPVYANEIDARLAAVPDGENAAVLLEQAITAITFTTESGVYFTEFVDEPKTFEEKMAAAKELVESNHEVLALARRARERPQVAWSHRLKNLFTNFNPGLASGQRSIAKLLWFSAAYHYRTGNHAEAIEIMHDFLALSEAVDAHPTLISSLVAWAIYALAFALVEDVGASLSVDDAAAPSGTGHAAASRKLVEGLITTLLNEESSRRALTQTFYGERAYQLDMLESISQGAMTGIPVSPASLWSRATNFLQEPLLKLDIVRMTRHYTLLSEVAAAPSWPLAAKQVPVMSNSPFLVGKIARPLSEINFDMGSRWIQLHFKCLARRRMAATALAIRLYVVDIGQRPTQLTQLVPDYLPAVPVDPFAADGTMIRYKLDAERPVLYSVGHDGTDNGGVRTLRPNGRIDSDKSDILFYLDGRVVEDEDTASEALSETGKDDENRQDHERQPDESQPGEPNPK